MYNLLTEIMENLLQIEAQAEAIIDAVASEVAAIREEVENYAEKSQIHKGE